MFEFLGQAKIKQMIESRVFNTLISFENNRKDGHGFHFNFILSNGTRSTQRDEEDYYDHMVPTYALNKIRSVTIYYWPDIHITGFCFFDKDGVLLWKIGNTTDFELKKETVVLEENERIIGVVAKLFAIWQSVYTDF